MKKLIYISILCLFNIHAFAQASVAWNWALTDTAAAHSINPGALHDITAAGAKTILWGYPVGKTFLYGSDVMANYQVMEYDTAAKQLHGTMAYGKLYFIDAQTDANGNWYLLGRYFDTMQFAGGHIFTRNALSGTAPDYFVVRLNAGTLDFAWLQPIGADYINSAATFTIANNALYVPVDSGGIATFICKLDLSTGARTTLWTQGGQSYTSSIQVDNNGNVYLAGSCAFTEIDFNGHKITGPSSYPAFMVKYKANGQYAWSHFMSDVTCAPRKLTLATNNIIYYSGTVHDTMSLGGFAVHHPAWVYDFLVSKLDSNGNVQWLRQLKDTLTGDAYLEYPYHAAACADNSLSVFACVRHFIDWGNSITTNTVSDQPAILNFSATGIAQWAAVINADYATTAHIASFNNSLYVAGYGTDSTSLGFGSISLPTSGAYNYTPYLARLSNKVATNVINTSVAELSFSIAPNPATGTIYLSAANQNSVTIRMIDISGKTV
ncbi:MAG: hypothetical protein JSS96_05090, partial [Bacteroidetes bacterium]|nr:hypothetical protein [Bacteroidota bacterium]